MQSRFGLVAITIGAIALVGVAVGAFAKSDPGQIYKIISAPLESGEWAAHTQSVGTTPLALRASDVAAADRNARFGQMFRIANRDLAKSLCFAPVAFATSCTAACAASGITCSGAATDGAFIPAGAQYVSPLIAGDLCGCVVASSASAVVTSEYISRYHSGSTYGVE